MVVFTKTSFFRTIQEQTDNYVRCSGKELPNRFYYTVDLTEISRKKHKESILYKPGFYYRLFEKRQSCILTGSVESLFNFVAKKYGKNVNLAYKNDFYIGKSITVSQFLDEVDFSKTKTVSDFLSWKPKTENEKVMKKSVECAKKQLKLKGSENVAFAYLVGHGRSAGELEVHSGWLITSNRIFTRFFLEFDEKKGYYLNRLNPIKIIELK